MQFVGKLTEADLNGVRKNARSKTSPAMSLGAIPKIVFRLCAVPMALASVAAISLAAALSFGCYGAAKLLGRVRPLRDAYEFLSRAYDRSIDRLGQEVLRDPRDTPALRLMVSLSLTAVPIFVMQLVLGKPRLLLAIAFYLALYGLKFQRFVRMFSASHIEAHRRQGYFSAKWDRGFGRYLEFFLGYLYGNIPELGRTAHVCLHHRENSGPDDTRNTMGYDRTSRLDFLWYLSDNIWTVLVLVPLFCMNSINAITAWVQHAFCDPERPEDYFTNSVTVVNEVNFMNEGYHLCHHHRASLHWTEMPVHFERIRDRMSEAGSLVFRDLDFMGLFVELTLFRRMDVLAEKLVPWEPMNHEQKLALLAKRTSLRTP